MLKRSYDARAFSSAHAAMAALRAEDFDLLISDLMMPELDGIALIKAALAINPQLIAILMTGQATLQTAAEAARLGTFDYVLKPFRMKTLMPIVQLALDSRRLPEGGVCAGKEGALRLNRRPN